MNYLEICQRMRQKSGIDGTGPLSVLNQTGMYLKIVNWVNEAWEELQGEYETWTFMQAIDRTLPLSIGVDTYNLETLGVEDVAEVKTDRLRLYDTTVGNPADLTRLKYVPWETYRDRLIREIYTERPREFTILENGAIRLLQYPDLDTYEFLYDCRLKPTLMVENIDVPTNLPARFHMALVHMAQIKFAQFEAAPEIETGAREALRTVHSRMQRDLLPPLSYGNNSIGDY